MVAGESPGSSPDEPSPTLEDLKRLVWAVALFELAIVGLALLSRAFFGARLAIVVGVVIGALVLAAFVLVVAFSLGATAVEEYLERRARRRQRRASDWSPPPTG